MCLLLELYILYTLVICYKNTNILEAELIFYFSLLLLLAYCGYRPFITLKQKKIHVWK